MKKVVMILVIISCLLLVSCQSETKNEHIQENVDETDNQGEQEKLDVPLEGVLKGDWCIKGTTYTFGEDKAEVLGLEDFKGKEWCKAKATTISSNELGKITMDSIYYYDESQKEFWIQAVMTGDAFPEPQVTETHIIDGKVVG